MPRLSFQRDVEHRRGNVGVVDVEEAHRAYALSRIAQQWQDRVMGHADVVRLRSGWPLVRRIPIDHWQHCPPPSFHVKPSMLSITLSWRDTLNSKRQVSAV
jgi:hypothetical protein